MSAVSTRLCPRLFFFRFIVPIRLVLKPPTRSACSSEPIVPVQSQSEPQPRKSPANLPVPRSRPLLVSLLPAIQLPLPPLRAHLADSAAGADSICLFLVPLQL